MSDSFWSFITICLNLSYLCTSGIQNGIGMTFWRLKCFSEWGDRVTLKAISKFPLSACVAITGAEVSHLFLCVQCSFHAIIHLITLNALYQLQQSTRVFFSARASTVSLTYVTHKRLTWDCCLICPSFWSITRWSKINAREVVSQRYLNIWGEATAKVVYFKCTSVGLSECMYVSAH